MTDHDGPDPLMALFRTEVREQLAHLRAATGEVVKPEAIVAAHTVRGAARIVGSNAVATS